MNPPILKLELTPQDMQILSNALIDRPFREVAELINKINSQLISQQQLQSPIPQQPPAPSPPQSSPPAPPLAPQISGFHPVNGGVAR